MKVRDGYVSNSSSSSFIVSEKGYFPTVKSVAEYIIKTIKSEWGSEYGFIEELKTLRNMNDPDTPVFFNTGGDETYIRKVDGRIVLCTTQNISFPKIIDNALVAEDIPEEFYRKFDYFDEKYKEEVSCDDPNDFDYYYPKFDDFLVLRHNFYGRHTYVDNCPNCKQTFSRGWILKGGKEICDCKISQIIRKEKLNKINES